MEASRARHPSTGVPSELTLLRDYVPYVLYVFDVVSFEATFLNGRVAEVLGYDPARVAELGTKPLLHPDDVADMPRLLRDWEQAPDGATLESEYRLRHADGSWRWFLGHHRVVGRAPDGKLTRLFGTALDVTRQKDTERQLWAAQKMEAVGRLAGSVAHDFNNLLTVILGNVSLLLGKPSLEVSLVSPLREIEEVGEHAALLTRQLLSFARKEVVRPEPVDPNQVIDRIRRVLRRLLPDSVSLAFDLAAEVGWVLIDRAQLVQVVLNLVLNARDAMPQGGRLDIRTERALVDPGLSVSGRLGSCPYVRLTVRDSGVGMDAVTVGRIFEPFFTTKQDRASGLGLPTVQDIVRNARGVVRVHSQPGVGSAFEVLLPEADGPPVVAAPLRHKRAVAPATGRAILVVEDDPMIARVANAVLKGAGYRVMHAANGVVGLALLETRRREVDLVLSDVMMPGMTGVEMALALRARGCAVPVMLMSGYARDDISPEDRAGLADVTFLAKPFSARELLAAIERLLGD